MVQALRYSEAGTPSLASILVLEFFVPLKDHLEQGPDSRRLFRPCRSFHRSGIPLHFWRVSEPRNDRTHQEEMHTALCFVSYLHRSANLGKPCDLQHETNEETLDVAREGRISRHCGFFVPRVYCPAWCQCSQVVCHEKGKMKSPKAGQIAHC